MRFTTTAIALHWIVAAAVVAQLAFGWYLGDIARGTPGRGSLVNLHKSIGLVIWMLVVIRLGWRWGHPPPPEQGPAWQRSAARVTHTVLYAVLFTMPAAAYLASNFSKYGVVLFGVVKLRPWGHDDPALYAFLSGVHVACAWILAAFVSVHVAGALYHAWKRDGVMGRMLPRLRGT